MLGKKPESRILRNKSMKRILEIDFLVKEKENVEFVVVVKNGQLSNIEKYEATK